MRQPSLQLRQAFQRAPTGAARAGDEDAALLRERVIVCGVAPAQPVKERLKAFRHVQPVNGADPDDAVRFLQCLIDIGKVILNDARALLVASPPAVSAGATMFDPLPIQVYLPDLCSSVRQAKNELILGRCRQAVRIGAGPYDCDIFSCGVPSNCLVDWWRLPIYYYFTGL